MLLFPDVQAKAQREIDEVVGTGRLPTLDDQPNLPYVERLIQEVLRWQPVTPIGNNVLCLPREVSHSSIIIQDCHVYAPKMMSTRVTRSPQAQSCKRLYAY